MSSTVYDTGRVPVIPIAYQEQYKSILKEMMVDYETGDIYIVSATDKTKIFNITKDIKNTLKNLKSDDMTVEIEGVGVINLTTLLNQFRLELDEQLHTSDINHEESLYIEMNTRIDNKSIINEDHIIQLNGFYNAEDLTMPQKVDGVIRWIPVPQLTDISTGGTGTISDGFANRVINVIPSDGKIYLQATRRQKSVGILENIVVDLPRTIDQYAEIKWILITTNFMPVLAFQGANVVWEITGNFQPMMNSHQVYEFETWDGGMTWLGKVNRYNVQVIVPEDVSASITWNEL